MKIQIDKDLAEFIVAMCRNNGISYTAYTNSLLEKAIQKEHRNENAARKNEKK